MSHGFLTHSSRTCLRQQTYWSPTKPSLSLLHPTKQNLIQACNESELRLYVRTGIISDLSNWQTSCRCKANYCARKVDLRQCKTVKVIRLFLVYDKAGTYVNSENYYAWNLYENLTLFWADSWNTDYAIRYSLSYLKQAGLERSIGLLFICSFRILPQACRVIRFVESHRPVIGLLPSFLPC